MSDIMAAIGRVQLSRFDVEFKLKRLELLSYYLTKLVRFKGLEILDTDLTAVVPHIMPVRILCGKRDKVKLHMDEVGIQTGVHYKPNHLLSKYKSKVALPVAEQLYTELLSLPMHVDLKLEEIDAVVSALEHALDEVYA